MLSRCYNPNATGYKNYGGRGITVCDSWRDCFENFLRDMGDRPEKMSLDRINNNDGYSKENCKWSTVLEQNRNKRTTRVYFGASDSEHNPVQPLREAD